jgi:hypothetical protein
VARRFAAQTRPKALAAAGKRVPLTVSNLNKLNGAAECIMLACPPTSMEGRESDEVQITSLKAGAVMCEMTGCERPARSLVKYKSGALQAVCEKHANAIGSTER